VDAVLASYVEYVEIVVKSGSDKNLLVPLFNRSNYVLSRNLDKPLFVAQPLQKITQNNPFSKSLFDTLAQKNVYIIWSCETLEMALDSIPVIDIPICYTLDLPIDSMALLDSETMEGNFSRIGYDTCS
jgi:hypothetical protein